MFFFILAINCSIYLTITETLMKIFEELVLFFISLRDLCDPSATDKITFTEMHSLWRHWPIKNINILLSLSF